MNRRRPDRNRILVCSGSAKILINTRRVCRDDWIARENVFASCTPNAAPYDGVVPGSPYFRIIQSRPTTNWILSDSRAGHRKWKPVEKEDNYFPKRQLPLPTNVVWVFGRNIDRSTCRDGTRRSYGAPNVPAQCTGKDSSEKDNAFSCGHHNGWLLFSFFFPLAESIEFTDDTVVLRLDESLKR